METVRLTTAQAIVRWLIAQRTEIDGIEVPLFPGVFGIFGHGNVVSLAEALAAVQDALPTWRGHNEQSMALAAVAFAKAKSRRQIMIATSSVGPGSTNMVTAAAVAHANRLPLLLISGDTFQHRIVDPVLQQVEHFGNPATTVSDVFRAVTRFWDRITRPEQIIQTLPQALAIMLDPAECGPAYIGLPQDIAAEAYDFPVRFFGKTVHYIRRPGPDARDITAAAAVLAAAAKPLFIAGGGVHYSGAVDELTAFAVARGIPVVETVAGKSTLVYDHPNFAGPIGVTGSTSANALAADADVVVAVGTRLQDFTTGSWTVFENPRMQLVSINVGRFDATKHHAVSVVGDARVSLEALNQAVGDYHAPAEWLQRSGEERRRWYDYLDDYVAGDFDVPTYAQVIRAVNDLVDDTDYQVSAAGGLPGELNMGWQAKSVGSFDVEYGYSCMGYEIAGAWGAKMALPDRDVISWVGDGSYLMMNSDIYSTVATGHKVIFIVCDNGGFAVINRLQVGTGGEEFNNLLEHTRRADDTRVDFVSHAASLGAIAEKVTGIEELGAAFRRAKDADRSSVIVIDTHPYEWTDGGGWWEVGVPEVSDREQVLVARAEWDAGRKNQRVGIWADDER
ncbi:MAG: 3D-(3,5/4)-trihydroxycyclohexane-1,2-dione acylhydrolase (decyclizing) [Acidimicrobiia bacterium]|nr:MAG: 3D-(3,5/4)-trihydroxycyclohexane-1,2-dione acylhydrolase (decyclizing) [Acidimicrobiia bacterium]